VTHGITYLPHVNQIIVLKDGEISEKGTYRELISNKGAFAEFLNDQLRQEDLEESESDKEYSHQSSREDFDVSKKHSKSQRKKDVSVGSFDQNFEPKISNYHSRKRTFSNQISQQTENSLNDLKKPYEKEFVVNTLRVI